MKRRHISHAPQFKHEIPVIGFGAMGISEFYGTTDENAACETIQIALENGINHFDTADGYAFGDNEVFLSKTLNLSDTKTRESLIIASKAGILRDRNDPTLRGVCIKPDYLQKQLERSLKNLSTQYLDIFYIHRLPPNASKEELETLAHFLLSVKEKGLAKSIGLSEPDLEQLKLIHSICPVSFVQSEYSLLERGVETNGILNFCKANQIQFVAYSPLCRGLLTDGFDPDRLEQNDFRASLPKFSGDNYQKNLKIINELKEFAKNRNMPLSSLALAWLIAQDVIVIPGMRKVDRVSDSVCSLQYKLSEEDLFKLDQIAFVGATEGMRYNEASMKANGFKPTERKF